jgi:FdhE protein
VAAVTTVDPAFERWLSDHPYLREVARFQQVIEDVLRDDESTALPVPQWDLRLDDFGKGIPMLGKMPLDEEVVSRAGNLLLRLGDRMSMADCPEEVRRACGLLGDELRRSPDKVTRLLKQLVSDEGDGERDTGAPSGTVRYLAWRAMERVLRPWVERFEDGAEADLHWGRPYCPLCGSLPAMAQLVRTRKGRERYLSCGCCRCRWSFQRTGCPFCGNQDQDKMEILELEQEKEFRIDVCRRCDGYLKTYTGEGDEGLMLADWSTPHLDILAGRQGLRRSARSLYEL